MSYQTCNTLFPTRDAAIRGLIAEWLDLPRLADCTESAADLVAQARANGWFSEFEAQYGAIDDADAAEFVDEMRDDAREDRFRDALAMLDVYGLDSDGDDFECSGLALLLDNEDADEILDALRRLVAGEVAVPVGGGAGLGVVLTALTDDALEAMPASELRDAALDGDAGARVRLAMALNG